jgi:hypothetical protein
MTAFPARQSERATVIYTLATIGMLAVCFWLGWSLAT